MLHSKGVIFCNFNTRLSRKVSLRTNTLAYLSGASANNNFYVMLIPGIRAEDLRHCLCLFASEGQEETEEEKEEYRQAV